MCEPVCVRARAGVCVRAQVCAAANAAREFPQTTTFSLLCATVQKKNKSHGVLLSVCDGTAFVCLCVCVKGWQAAKKKWGSSAAFHLYLKAQRAAWNFPFRRRRKVGNAFCKCLRHAQHTHRQRRRHTHTLIQCNTVLHIHTHYSHTRPAQPLNETSLGNAHCKRVCGTCNMRRLSD